MKFLFVDDSAEMLGSLRRAFFNNPNVAFTECHNVEDALRAIAEQQPDVVFLDHHLTDDGNEGLEIADRVEGVKIYSTTSNSSVVPEYQKLGIENVGKTDLGKLKSIIAAQPTNPKKEEQAMNELTAKEAMTLIDQVGPSLGCGDFTYGPVFPEGRTDVCAVRRMAENGRDYGFDTIYLVWKEPDGSVKHREIKNSRSTKDYINIDSVVVGKDGSVSVKFKSGGSYSGVPWSESMKVAISSGQAQVSKEAPSSYAEQAKQAMVAVVENHRHNHPLYKPTVVKESVIDEDRKIAVFILFEQIDTDRCTEHGEGWLGDQFRYSLWKMNGDSEPIRLYEDHAYIRRSKSELTGTRGRDCSLKSLKLEGDAIKGGHHKGERGEDQEPEELTFNL